MKTISFKLSTLELIINSLKKGKVIAHPADTCFGLTGDLLNKNVIQKIQDIKGRAKLKPMSLMLPLNQLDQIEKWAVMNKFSWKIAKKLLPGPVTLILPKGSKIPDWYFPETDLIGIRIPNHQSTQFILEAFKGPLITTSANLSGETICFKHQEVINTFKDNVCKPHLVVEGKLTTHNSASTVIKIEDDFVRILRKGPINKKDLEEILGVQVVS